MRSFMRSAACAALLCCFLTSVTTGQNVLTQLPGPESGRIYAVETTAQGDPLCLTQTHVFRWDDATDAWETAHSFWVDVNNKNLYRTPDGTLYACAVTARLLVSKDDGRSWQRVEEVTDYSKDIVSNASGELFHVGNTVMYSPDGGSTWAERNAGLEGEYLNAIVCGTDGALYTSAPQSGIFKSTDRAASWTQLSGAPTYMFDLYAASDGRIWAAGNDGAFSSTDGGTTWVQAELPSRISTITQHPDGDLYAAVDSPAGQIHRSTDGGTTWSTVDDIPDRLQCDCLVFAPDGRGYAATRSGVLASPDGISPWVHQNSGLLAASVPCVVAAPGGDILASVNEEGLYRSTDHGVSWRKQDTGFDVHFVTTLAVFDGNIYALTSDYLYRSSDGGTQWSRLNPDDRFDSGDAVFVDASGTIYVSVSGGAMTSTDDGATWTLRGDGCPDATMRGIVQLGDGTLAMVSLGDGLYLSTDQGMQWTQSASFPEGRKPVCLASDGQNALYVGTSGNALYRSSDAGQHWEQIVEGYGNRYVGTVLVTDEGAVYSGTTTGAFLLAPDADAWVKLEGLDYRCNGFSVNADGRLLVATDTEGLLISAEQVAMTPPATPDPLSPINGASETGANTLFTWQRAERALYYRLQLSHAADMQSITVDTVVPVSESIRIYNLDVPSVYSWRIAAGNGAGLSAWSAVATFNTGRTSAVGDMAAIPLQLGQNYPNPFREKTNIRLSLERAGHVELTLHAIDGRRLQTLFDGELPQGSFTVPVSTALPSGAYFYRLRTAAGSRSRRLVIQH